MSINKNTNSKSTQNDSNETVSLRCRLNRQIVGRYNVKHKSLVSDWVNTRQYLIVTLSYTSPNLIISRYTLYYLPIMNDINDTPTCGGRGGIIILNSIFSP